MADPRANEYPPLQDLYVLQFSDPSTPGSLQENPLQTTPLPDQEAINELLRRFGFIQLPTMKELTKGAAASMVQGANRKRAAQQPAPLPPLPPPDLRPLPPPEAPAPTPPPPPTTTNPTPEVTPPTVQAPQGPPNPVTVVRIPGFLIDPAHPKPEHWDWSQLFSPSEVHSRIVEPPPSPGDLDDFLNRLRLNRPLPGQPDPTQAEPRPLRPATAGDPIELATGAFVIQVTDLTVPSPHLPIAFVRSYRSGRPYNGPFGFAWDHNFNAYLRHLADGRLALWAGGLHELYFKPSGAGWDGAEGVFARIVESAVTPGSFEVQWPGGQVWRLVAPPGWSDGERTPLRTISNGPDDTLTLDYDRENRLSAVSDPEGRGLRFIYGSCDLLEVVTDHTGQRSVRYLHHDGVEVLLQVVQPATAMFPAGIRTTYEYDLDSEIPAARFNILRVLDAYDRLCLENRYAAPGESWASNGVVWQRVGDDEYRFEYEHIQYAPPDPEFLDVVTSRTQVLPPDGALHVYSFNAMGLVLDHRLRLVRDGSWRLVVEQARYDAQGNRTLVARADGSTTHYTYDSQALDCRARGNLQKIEEAAALPGLNASRTVARLFYEPAQQRLIRVVDETGAETRLVYGGAPAPDGRLLELHLPQIPGVGGAPQPAVQTYAYTPQGQLASITSPAGVVTRYEYFAAGPHRRFVSGWASGDPGAGLRQLFEYDAAGFLSAIDDGPGRRTTFAANALGQTEVCTLPPVDGAAAVFRQQFNEAGVLARRERPVGAAADRWTSADMIVDAYEHDLLGRTILERRAAGASDERIVRYRLDHEGRIVQQWTPTGYSEAFERDERGLILRHTAAAGSSEAMSTRFGYDHCGRRAYRIDPDGSETRWDYDAWGRPRRIRRPDGSATRLVWGPGDRLTEVYVEADPDAMGVYQTQLRRELMSYDARGRVTSHTIEARFGSGAATPLTIQFVHDADGRPTAITDPNGVTRRFGYDAAGRLATAEDGFGNLRTWTYDLHGAATNIQVRLAGAAAGLDFNLVYDSWNRPVRLTAPGVDNGWAWDLAGQLTDSRSAGERVSSHVANLHGESVEVIRDPDGLALSQRWTRDGDGHVTAFRDATNASTSFARDAAGRITTLTLPDGRAWRYDYDDAARIHTCRSPAGTALRTRLDPACVRPLEISATAAVGVAAVAPHTFRYDGLGRVVEAVNGGATITRAYDTLGRLRRETAAGATVQIDYDDLARTRDVLYPHGLAERTQFDVHGRPVTIAYLDSATWRPALSLTYDGPGRLLRTEAAGGPAAEYRYDDVGRVISIVTSLAGATVEDRRTAFDARGRRALVQVDGQSRFNRFDGADRLIGAARGFSLPLLPATPSAAVRASLAAAAAAPALLAASRDTFALDGGDARLSRSRTEGGVTQVTTYGLSIAHQITSIDGATVTSDADGARRSDTRYRYDFDTFGRLAAVHDSASNQLLHRLDYDPLLRQASGEALGTPYQRWFLGDSPIEELSPGGMVAAQSYLADASPPWRIAALSQTHHILVDDQLSTSAEISGAGVVRYDFSAFGAPLAPGPGPGATPGAAWWRGMPRLAGTTLHQASHRTYDPETGVFLSPDPLVYADSPSPYAFAAHNPADFADASGLAKEALAPATPPPQMSWPHRQSLGVWQSHTPFDIFPQSEPIETGSTALNFLANRVVSVSNMLWAQQNMMAAPATLAIGIFGAADRKLREIGINPEALHGVSLPGEFALFAEGAMLELNTLRLSRLARFSRTAGGRFLTEAPGPPNMTQGAFVRPAWPPPVLFRQPGPKNIYSAPATPLTTLPQIPRKTTATPMGSGYVTLSGWGEASRIPGYEEAPAVMVWRYLESEGFRLPSHYFDYADTPGTYYASHAELQALYLDVGADFVEVSRAPCFSCAGFGIPFFARTRQMTIVVLGPDGFHWFYPDGSHIR